MAPVSRGASRSLAGTAGSPDGLPVIREAADAQPTQAMGPGRPYDVRQGAGHEGQLVGARREPAGQGVRVQIVLGRFGSRRASALMIRGWARPLATDQTNVLPSRPTLESALITATRSATSRRTLPTPDSVPPGIA